MRTEHDSMGDMEVPDDALYGASTQRAVLNFPISGWRMPPVFLRALALVKWAAAKTNGQLDRLTPKQTQAIMQAAEEMMAGQLDQHFPVDVFQTGSGTSSNMNANEVLARRGAQLANEPGLLHPNDHVNLGQSSNDVIPTAMHLALAELLQSQLAPELEQLHQQLTQKSQDFWDILKLGRTHLMDATPVRLGQVFSGYARQIEKAKVRNHLALQALLELPLGGTAVGTGLNTHPQFAARCIQTIVERTGLGFCEAANHFEAQASKDAMVEAGGQLKTIAISLIKIANDLRWLASGPHGGLGELQLPATQPGSSIMPGKVNPVLPEALIQTCVRVVGMDSVITWSAAQSNLELNVMMPLMIWESCESVRCLAAALKVFRENCLEDLQADPDRCRDLMERSLALVTGLVPYIGYDRSAELAKESARTGKTLRVLCQEKGLLSDEQIEKALDPTAMTAPEA
ncbi:MAG: class II fumarate hydratase [Verrucomicrobiales bacterium]